MKTWKRSSVSALVLRRIVALIASSTTELNTIGRRPSRSGDLVDLLDHGVDLLGRIDERYRQPVKLDLLELRQQAVAEHLGGDAGAVRDEEDGAAGWHAGNAGRRKAGIGTRCPCAAPLPVFPHGHDARQAAPAGRRGPSSSRRGRASRSRTTRAARKRARAPRTRRTAPACATTTATSIASPPKSRNSPRSRRIPVGLTS